MTFEVIDKNIPCDVYISSYSAGKEELFIEISKKYNTKIWVEKSRFVDLEILGLVKYFTLDESNAWIFLNRFNFDEEDRDKEKQY